MKYNIIIALFIFTFSANVYSQTWLKEIKQQDEINFYSIQKKFNQFWKDKEPKKGNGYKQIRRWENYWQNRLFPEGEYPNPVEMANLFKSAVAERNKYDKALGGSSWQEEGPITIPTNKIDYTSGGLGRVTCVRFDPNNENIIFIGSASGGIWKSTNSGNGWTPLEMSSILSLGISDIAISKMNSSVIYAGTGDPNGVDMSRGYSVGVIKSTNGGSTWFPTSLAYEIKDNFQVGSVLVFPNNSNYAIAGTSQGIWKTTDGGISWAKKTNNLFFRHLVFSPNNSDYIYASTFSYSGGAAIYVSIDGGETWNLSKSFSSASRIALAVTPADDNYVYALCVNASTDGFLGFYVSTDRAANWALKSQSPNILDITDNGSSSGGQGFYDLALAVSKTNKNIIYSGGIHIWKSTDLGVNWSLATHWQGINKPYVHADQHDLVLNSSNILYSANDGGVFQSTDEGATWSDLSNGLAIQQFYCISASNLTSAIITGGSQDNGTQYMKDGSWSHVRGGDGMTTLIDYSNDLNYYISYPNGWFERTTNGGLSFFDYINYSSVGELGAWETPMVQDPKDPSTLYVAYFNVWKISNGTNTKTKLSNFSGQRSLEFLSVSPSNPEVIYTGYSNKLYYTIDGGSSGFTLLNTMNKSISHVEVDPENPYHIWVSLSGYSDGVKVFEYKSKTWTNLSSNLPNVPINKIIYNKNDRSLIVATDIGVYQMTSGATTWNNINGELPIVSVTDLILNYSNGRLYAATFGRGLWSMKLYDCNLAKPSVNIIGSLSFCDGDSVILRVPDDYSSYFWSNGAIGKSITVKTSGEYYVTVINETGCAARSDTFNAVALKVPNLIINTPQGKVVCLGDSLTLRASAGFAQYSWSNGETTQTIYIKKAGSYSVDGITVDGCANSSKQVEISEVMPPEKPQVSINDNILSAPVAAKYQWYKDGEAISGATGASYTVMSVGYYQVRITDENNCSSISDSIFVETSVIEINLAKIAQFTRIHSMISLILSSKLAMSRQLSSSCSILREML
jgi:hypothetical protein